MNKLTLDVSERFSTMQRITVFKDKNEVGYYIENRIYLPYPYKISKWKIISRQTFDDAETLIANSYHLFGKAITKACSFFGFDMPDENIFFQRPQSIMFRHNDVSKMIMESHYSLGYNIYRREKDEYILEEYLESADIKERFPEIWPIVKSYFGINYPWSEEGGE